MNETYVVLYSCKHTRIFSDPPPRIGDPLWCTECDEVVSVVSAPPEWRIRCQNCVFARPFGTAKINAEIGAAKHRLKHPDHVVDIYNGNAKIKTFGNRDQTVIPMSSESNPEIPF